MASSALTLLLGIYALILPAAFGYIISSNGNGARLWHGQIRRSVCAPRSKDFIPAPTLRSKVSSSVISRLSMGNKEMTPEEVAEYEALMQQARDLQKTFDSMIGNAFGGQQEVEETPPQAKGFQIPIEEDDSEPQVEYEPPPEVDVSQLSPEERAQYQMSKARTEGDDAYEAAEAALKAGDRARAAELHAVAVDRYTFCGMLDPRSIFFQSFKEALDKLKASIDA